MEEIWKDIPNYEGLYQVSNLGKVRSIERTEYTNRFNKNGKHIKACILCPRVCGKKRNYYSVALFKNGTRKDYRIHRLVMDAFVGKSNLTVNHKNEITTDNRLENLEYMSNHNNIRYSKAKRVKQFDIDGQYIKTWDAIVDAQKTLNIGHISQCCSGKRKTAGGFIWKYEGDELK